MEAKALIDALAHVLADTYALYLKTQSYHWHVTGPNFSSLHALFEEQYTDLANAVDEIAERIRILDGMAPATFGEFGQLKTIADGDAKADATTMLKHLHADQKVILGVLHTALKEAHAIEDEGTIGLLTLRLETHEKQMWMLGASLV